MKYIRGKVEGEPRFLLLEDEKLMIAPIGSSFETIHQNGAADFESFTGSFEPLPCVNPSKVVCVGRNYAEHAKELGNEVPSEPLLFLKAPTSVTGHNEHIVLPAQSSQIEHEGELCIVIGRGAKHISDDENVDDYIFGYTCLNDVTARDLQKRDGQFARAKSFDTFCPVGPFIETKLNTDDIAVKVRVNGEIKQDGRTSQMIFDIPFLMRYISRQMTLLPGDIIATGTPSGVSALSNGDLCEVEIEGIGTLQNRITKQD